MTYFYAMQSQNAVIAYLKKCLYFLFCCAQKNNKYVILAGYNIDNGCLGVACETN